MPPTRHPRPQWMDSRGNWHEYPDLGEVAMGVRIRAPGLTLQVIGRDASVEVIVHPVSGESVALDIQEVAAHDAQVHLRVAPSLKPSGSRRDDP